MGGLIKNDTPTPIEVFNPLKENSENGFSPYHHTRPVSKKELSAQPNTASVLVLIWVS